uniref:Uncharacterized protein n=1 Tax=Triticum urartu TaxID=4572 RepID=A0A8R7PJB6_TRIUA
MSCGVKYTNDLEYWILHLNSSIILSETAHIDLLPTMVLGIILNLKCALVATQVYEIGHMSRA